MKTRGIKDLYLPQSISTHVKILLICAAFSPLWGLYMNQFNSGFIIGTFAMMILDLEIFYFILNRISVFGEKQTRKFEDTHTRKQVTLFYLGVLVLFLTIALVVCTLVFGLFIIVLYLIKGWDFPHFFEIVNQLKGVIKVTAIALLCSTPISFLGWWQKALKRGYELKEQNLIFQNETLKNQVNPHFLFNSLNTLSSLMITQTEIAGQFIGKLSSIYRYILENGSKDKVLLSEEMAFIRDYFSLYEVRSEGKILLSIEVDEKADIKILPVSLQLLIENAIKHNMATLEKPLNITIYIEGENIVVRNNIQKMATQVVSTKIGLKNLSDRVRLIAGKEIIVEETANDFLVKVPLLS
jgi:two-component system LytT family sensor kinase